MRDYYIDGNKRSRSEILMPKSITIPIGGLCQLSIRLELMPSHSRELQPAERLWPLANEPIANKTFANLDRQNQRKSQVVHTHQRNGKDRDKSFLKKSGQYVKQTDLQHHQLVTNVYRKIVFS